MKIFILSILPIFGISSFVLKFIHKDENHFIYNTTNNEFKQSLIRTTHGNNVNIYEIKKSGKSFGHSIWINRTRKQVKAKYFAFKRQNRYETTNVYERYLNWKSGKNVVLACSGAFSTELPGEDNQNAITVGLTVDNGKIVNRSIDSKMDGLVIVYDSGGIVVSDIENKNLDIGGRKISLPKDKVALLNWAVQNKATIFQTQLLAYDNSLRISRAGRVKSRERRFLALAQIPGKDLYHIIFDLPKNNYLFDSARDVFNFLKDQKGMEIFAILNLDTGSYNVMELYKDFGQLDYDINGETDIKMSTNLIVYHYLD